MYIKRRIEKDLQEMARFFPVLSLIGPRQSGKTTVAKHVFSHHAYVNLENSNDRAFAQEDPIGFLATHTNEHGLIIDEFQVLPELLRDLMVKVDEDRKPGKYILTGSRNYLLNRTHQQSLAGRVSLHTLLPLSCDELAQAHELSESVDDFLYKGGYPAVYGQGVPVDRFYENYVRVFVQQDVLTLQTEIDRDKFARFLRLCAARMGQLLNYSSLAKDCEVSDQTIRRWILLLEKGFIAYRLKPYHNSFRKRLVKSTKLYFYDVGLARHLLGVSRDQVATFYLRGNFFEGAMVSEIQKAFLNQGESPELYFWRDAAGHEVDLLLTYKGHTFPLEIKAGQTVAAKAFAGLTYWNELTKADQNAGFLVYGGSEVQRWRHGQVLSWRSVGEIKRLCDEYLETR